jgi:hypothetical protein
MKWRVCAWHHHTRKLCRNTYWVKKKNYFLAWTAHTSKYLIALNNVKLTLPLTLPLDLPFTSCMRIPSILQCYKAETLKLHKKWLCKCRLVWLTDASKLADELTNQHDWLYMLTLCILCLWWDSPEPQGHVLFLTGVCHCLRNYCKNVKKYIYLPELRQTFSNGFIELANDFIYVLSINWTPRVLLSTFVAQQFSFYFALFFCVQLIFIQVIFICDEQVQSAVNVL